MNKNKLILISFISVLGSCGLFKDSKTDSEESGANGAQNSGITCKKEGAKSGNLTCSKDSSGRLVWNLPQSNATAVQKPGMKCKSSGAKSGSQVCKPTSSGGLAWSTEGNETVAASSPPTGDGFASIGKSESEIKARIDTSWSEFRSEYMTGGAVKWIGNNTSIEAMSRTMMIAYALDSRSEFDSTYSWLMQNMYYHSGPYVGYSAWAVNIDSKDKCSTPECNWPGATKEIIGAATDGEVWYTTALLLAGSRWGRSDYTEQAKKNLNQYIKSRSGFVTPLFNVQARLPVFSPNTFKRGEGFPVFSQFTDPAYVVPSFFAAWSRISSDMPWGEVASTGRNYFKKAIHGTTGLVAENTDFNGSPVDGSSSQNGLKHGSDAIQVALNLVLDWQSGNKDPFIVQSAEKITNFFMTNEPNSMYFPDGRSAGSANADAQKCMLGVFASVIPPSETSRKWLKALWNTQGQDWYSRQYCLLGKVVVAKYLQQ